ncbi:MAG: hypothetical protein KF789_02110 [Bdellovibrionaceae bacterium]|nr:hypothetical protein [Pseudobdellovibrionaceae bacterium]
MIRALLVSLLVLSAPLALMAAGPEKHPPRPNTAPTNDVQGAVQVKDTPAVPPEALEANGQMEKKTVEKPMPASVASSSEGSHYFGFHGGVEIPHPINYGLNYVHSSGLFSAEISTGSFKHKIDDVDAKLENIELGLRWHPWSGSFFVGMLLGQHTVTATKTESITGFGDVTGTAKVKADYLTPHVGWMWGMEGGGFFGGFEIGYQSPMNSTVEYNDNAPTAATLLPEYNRFRKDVQDEGKKYGKMGLPYLALLKIGWLF